MIGGTYTFNQDSSETSLKASLVKAVKHCISTHPILSAAIVGEETDNANPSNEATQVSTTELVVGGADAPIDVLDQGAYAAGNYVPCNDWSFSGPFDTFGISTPRVDLVQALVQIALSQERIASIEL